MRTTIDVDEDVLQNVKQVAAQRQITLGAAVSDLLREALRPERTNATVRNGVPLFEPTTGGKLPSLALVNQLRDGNDEQ